MQPVDVFIHSSPHSGSTWLGYVLGSGRETAFVGELYREWDAEDRVPCTVCASRGNAECSLLGGIRQTKLSSIFSEISQRSNKRIIVENSKRTEWTRKFIGRPDRDLKVVHLVKDPRSRWASLRRREPSNLDQCMADWLRENQEIRHFTTSHGISTITVAYDIIAARPELEFPAIFDFIGSPFEPSVLRYWEVEHHGYAANGASSAMVQHQEVKSPPSHFSTGDDPFYNSMFGRSFVDERWRTELPAFECDRILENEAIRKLLQELGFRLTATSIERVNTNSKTLGEQFRAWLNKIKRVVRQSISQSRRGCL